MNDPMTTSETATPVVSFPCPHCGKNHKVKPALAGKKIKCPASGKTVLVPTARPLRSASRLWLLAALLAFGGAALVFAGIIVILALFLPPAEVKPEPPYESQLLSAAQKVKSLETDAIDVRSVPGINDRDLVALRDLPNLRHLNLDKAAITDRGLKEIAQVPSLRILSLTQTQVTDAGLAELKTLIALEDLRLDETGITDAGLIHVKALPQLRKLSLYQTSISDAGLVHLKHAFFLERLSLDKTAVGDEGLRHLSAQTNLRYLSVWNTRVSDAGIDRLKSALPRLQINK